MAEYYFIQNKRAGYLGNALVWYAIDGQGYTAYVQNAERFTEAEAAHLVSEDPDKYAMYKCKQVDRRLHLVLDSQDVKRLSENPTSQPNPWGEKCSYAHPNGTWAYTNMLQQQIADLEALINTPEIEDFSQAVSLEMIHQRNRWGKSHDMFKTPSDWIRLAIHLLGKASAADWADDTDKLKHHIITTAAALGNFHASVLAHTEFLARNAAQATAGSEADGMDQRCANSQGDQSDASNQLRGGAIKS